MKKIFALLATAAVIAVLLPASADAAGRHHARYVRADAPVYAADRAIYAERPVYAAAGLPADPLLYPVGGAIIGAVIGTVVGVAVAQPPRYVRN